MKKKKHLFWSYVEMATSQQQYMSLGKFTHVAAQLLSKIFIIGCTFGKEIL